jgi:hypothetical protein
MKTLKTLVVTGTLATLWLAASLAGAQSRTIQGESMSATVTVMAIEQSTRTLTVKDENGFFETLQAPPGMTRFSELKVGDRITARYYTNVVVRLKKPGEAAVDLDTAALTKNDPTGTAGGTAAVQRTITVVVTEKDPATSSVTVKGPNNYVYSRKVADKKAFDTLKVGDQLDMTWTEALLISVDSPTK